MEDSDDYYEILGVSRDASQSEIKNAFKKKAKKFHPDQSDKPNAEEKFKKISKAYEVLGDEEMRQRYDRFGKEGVEGAASQQRGGAQFTDIEDLLNEMGFGNFADLFGGRGRRGGGGRGRGRGRGRRKRKGSDLKLSVELDFEEAVFGTEKEFNLEKNEPCENCDGDGSLSDGREVCKTCNGKGKVSQSQGFFTVTETCPDCRGRGEEITDPCPECNGSGVVRRDKTINATIPAGVETGHRIRIDNEGEPGPGGRGDLYVEISVKPHPEFERKKYDLYTQKSISFVQAAMGDTVEVPLLENDETTEISIQEGTQTGEIITVSGKGVPHLNGSGRGDLNVQIQVVTPTDLSTKEREILEEFADERGWDVQEENSEGLFDKIRDSFSA